MLWSTNDESLLTCQYSYGFLRSLLGIVIAIKRKKNSNEFINYAIIGEKYSFIELWLNKF